MTAAAVERWSRTVARLLTELLPGASRPRFYAAARAVLARVGGMLDEAERAERGRAA